MFTILTKYPYYIYAFLGVPLENKSMNTFLVLYPAVIALMYKFWHIVK